MARKKIASGGLQVLLKEVLNNTPKAEADKLTEAYLSGKVITVSITSSMYGDPLDKQCAFQWSIGEDARLKHTTASA